MLTFYCDDLYFHLENNKEYLTNLLKDNDDEITENNLLKCAEYDLQDTTDIFYSCIKEYDNKNNYSGVLVVANLGLWYGCRQAQKIFKTLYDAIIHCTEDFNKFVFDNKNTTLKLYAHHHDGCNTFKFYIIKNNRKYAVKYNDLIACY